MSDNFIDPSSASHPDSVLRLSSAVHRFAIVSLAYSNSVFIRFFLLHLTRCFTAPHLHQPFINPKDQISFEDSFNTCSQSHSNTIAALQQADNRRREIKAAMASGKVIHSSLSTSLEEYIPVVNQILLSCKCELICCVVDLLVYVLPYICVRILITMFVYVYHKHLLSPQK